MKCIKDSKKLIMDEFRVYGLTYKDNFDMDFLKNEKYGFKKYKLDDLQQKNYITTFAFPDNTQYNRDYFDCLLQIILGFHEEIKEIYIASKEQYPMIILTETLALFLSPSLVHISSEKLDDT